MIIDLLQTLLLVLVIAPGCRCFGPNPYTLLEEGKGSNLNPAVPHNVDTWPAWEAWNTTLCSKCPCSIIDKRNYVLCDLLSVPLLDLPAPNHTTVIGMSMTNLTTLPDLYFINCINATVINLSGNLLTRLQANAFLGASNLIILYLDGNRIRNIDDDAFTGLGALDELHLHRNYFSLVTKKMMSPLSSLTRLHMYSNLITFIEPGSFDTMSLKYLYVGGNKLTTIDPYLLNSSLSLLEISLYYNNLTSVPEQLFARQAFLRVIYLFFNQITTLPRGLFNDQTKAASVLVSMDDNKVTYLPPNVFAPLGRRLLLSFQNNPLSCVYNSANNNLSCSCTGAYRTNGASCVLENDATCLSEVQVCENDRSASSPTCRTTPCTPTRSLGEMCWGVCPSTEYSLPHTCVKEGWVANEQCPNVTCNATEIFIKRYFVPTLAGETAFMRTSSSMPLTCAPGYDPSPKDSSPSLTCSSDAVLTLAPPAFQCTPSSSSTPSASSSATIIAITVTVFVLVLLAVGLLLLVLVRRSRGKVAAEWQLRLEVQQAALLYEHTKMILSQRYAKIIFDHGVELKALALPPDRVTLSERIGQGHYAEVWRGVYISKADTHPLSSSVQMNPMFQRGEGHSRKESDAALPLPAGAVPCAVKRLHDRATLEEASMFLMEIYLMSTLSHPHIVRVIGAVIASSTDLALVMELMAHGNLRDELRRVPGECSLEDQCQIALQVCAALRYLEEWRVLHRDLAARNVLLSSLWTAKLGDFGLSRALDNREYYRRLREEDIPIRWQPPEAIIDRVYSAKSDVWSFGIVLWEVFMKGETPYRHLANPEIVPFLQSGMRLPSPPHCPPEIYLLMLGCWHVEGSKRPRFSELHESLVSLLGRVSSSSSSPPLLAAPSPIPPFRSVDTPKNGKSYLVALRRGGCAPDQEEEDEEDECHI